MYVMLQNISLMSGLSVAAVALAVLHKKPACEWCL